jgi:D-alanine-D-alanine ligase-like ATP-grasp enzyme
MIVELKHNFKLLLDEIESRGIEVSFVKGTDLVKAVFGSHVEFMWHGLTRLISASDRLILTDKYYIKSLIREEGYAVAEGEVFSPDQLTQALAYATTLGYPVVLKPTDGSSGDCVYANLLNEKEFTQAFESFAQRSTFRNMLVEKHFEGDDYQFLLIKNKGAAVSKRTRPSVQGDAVSTILELMQRENARRKEARLTCLCEIYIEDSDGMRALSQQGLSLDSILPRGKSAYLRNNHNVAWGGFAEEVTDQVHPLYYEMLRGFFDLFQGSQYLVIDILARDIRLPPSNDNFIISEFNGRPAFSLYQQPAAGRPNFIVKDFVDLLFPETESLKGRLDHG